MKLRVLRVRPRATFANLLRGKRAKRQGEIIKNAKLKMQKESGEPHLIYCGSPPHFCIFNF
jgi:hypothetical protein